jgi:hypothetical protein
VSTFTPITPTIVYTLIDAWQILVANSTLPEDGINTSWLHLNNQNGGGGGGSPYPVYIIQANDAEASNLLSANADTAVASATTTTAGASAVNPAVLSATATNMTTAEIN